MSCNNHDPLIPTAVMGRKLASILVGDHLGQIKKVLWPSGEVSLIPDLPEPNSSNPVVSIQVLDPESGTQLISYKNGNIYTYDPVQNKAQQCHSKGNDSLVRALSTQRADLIFVYKNYLNFEQANKTKNSEIKFKKGEIKAAKVCLSRLAIVGRDIPLRVFDIKSKSKIYEADLPEKDWLGIQPECDVVDLDFVGPNRVATSSKSDSVIRVYDIDSSTTSPIIQIDLNHTVSNEYAEAGRFLSVASSTGEEESSTSTIVVGSNVGQLMAIELRFKKIKTLPKKKLQPRPYKVLGGFKGARGATIKDIKIFKADDSEDKVDHKVISCCLDRFLRIHNMSKTSGRFLDKQVYMKTKPLCCSPIFYK